MTGPRTPGTPRSPRCRFDRWLIGSSPGTPTRTFAGGCLDYYRPGNEHYRAQLRIVRRRISFNDFFKWIGLEALAHRFSHLYGRHLAFIFPAGSILWELEAVKEQAPPERTASPRRPDPRRGPAPRFRLTEICRSHILNHMVNYGGAPPDAVFGALANPTRRAILPRLARGESSVTELAAPFAISLPAISKHVRVLEDAGLLAREKDGRVHRCHLVTEPLKDAARWIAHTRAFWAQQLDSLADYLNRSQAKEGPAWPHPRRPPRPRSASRARSRRRGTGSSGRGPTRAS